MSELMPHLDGITGYFDVSSVDLTNNKWLNRVNTNLVDKYDMDLINGGTIQNDALYLTAAQYGQLQMSADPQTIYCVFKVITLQKKWPPIVTRQMTSYSSGYGFALFANTSNYIYLSLTSNGIVSNVIPDNYHVVCFTRKDGTAYLYIDGVLIGTGESKNGYYGGFCHINRYHQGGSFVDDPTDVEYRMCAFGATYHNENIVKINTEFLLNGIKPKNNRLAGTDAVAIAYAIARNQESAAALQELKKAYRDGTVNGDNGNDDVTEPYKTTDPDEPMPFPKDGESTINTDDSITDLTKGYWFACGDRDTETVKYYVKVWIEPYYYEIGSTIQRNEIYAAIYTADGTQFGDITSCGYQYSRNSFIIQTAIRAELRSKSLLIWCYCTDLDGGPWSPPEQATVYQLSNLSLGEIVWSGNVSPFI